MCSESGAHRGSLKLSANKQRQNQSIFLLNYVTVHRSLPYSTMLLYTGVHFTQLCYCLVRIGVLYSTMLLHLVCIGGLSCCCHRGLALMWSFHFSCLINLENIVWAQFSVPSLLTLPPICTRYKSCHSDYYPSSHVYSIAYRLWCCRVVIKRFLEQSLLFSLAPSVCWCVWYVCMYCVYNT